MRINGKKVNVEGIFIILIIISLVLENFKLFTILGASFKPVQAVSAFAVVYCFLFHAIDVKKIMWTIVFLAIPLAPLYRINDKMEFFKTYVIYAIIVTFVCFALPHLKKTFLDNPKVYLKVFNAVMAVVAILGIVQFILMNLFGIMFLENIYGAFQFHNSSYGMESGFYRAYSLFHEPSFFGLALNIALAINLVTVGKEFSAKKIIFIIMLVIATIMTISSSAIWIMAAIFFVYFISIKKININMVFGVLIAIGVIVLIVALVDVSFIRNSMSRLFYETNNENTSAYERLVTPFDYIRATMQHYPVFGRGFGQIGNVDKVGIYGNYVGVHNGVFALFVIFGLSSIPYYLWLVRQFFGAKYKRESRFNRIILFVAIFGMYFSTGSCISFDTFHFTTLVIFILSGLEANNAFEEPIALRENSQEA